MKAKFDLSFGNSVCVRQAFSEVVGCGYQFTNEYIMSMDYPVHTGDPRVVEITRKVIERQVGRDYKHVFITNGATGADVIALRAYRQQGYIFCRTREAPYYARFPGMIEAAGMEHMQSEFANSVLLIDLPTNPTGTFLSGIKFHKGPIILDAVYYNNVYCGKNPRPGYGHNVLTGSYSKLLGINGIRLGWIATDDDLLADRITKLIIAEYCGLSVPGTTLLKTYLGPDFDWDSFESKSKTYLDFNREEISKLEKYFGGEPVPKLGMFYYAPMDKACKKLMEKAGIIWTKGSLMGTDDNFGRLNVGQDINLTKEAVKNILKIDKK